MGTVRSSKYKKVVKPLDIIDIKLMLDSGRLAAKVNMFGTVLLEDSLSGESIKLMQLPDGYSFHTNGSWNKAAGNDLHWICSVCGRIAADRTSWCTCGADMRESMRNVNG